MFRCRQIARTVPLLVLAALLIACGRPDMAAEPPGDDGSGAQPPTDGVELDGSEWVLASLNGNDPVEGSRVTLKFSNGEVGGSAGCNDYGGKYTASEDGTLTTADLVRTMKLCQTPDGVMEQEEAYIEALENAAAYALSDNRLEIKNAAGETALVFDQQDAASLDAALTATEWELTSLRGNKPIDGSHISLRFDGETAGGFSGCNAYGGEYTATADASLSIPGIGGTEMLCETPEGVMEQEQRYTETLQAAASYQIHDGRLEIKDATGETILVFIQKERFSNNPHDLVGTAWLLRSLDGGEPLAGSSITLRFGEGEFSGYGGCRHYKGTYEASAEEIHFPSVGMEESDCIRPRKFMEQEGQYTDHFTWASNYRLTEEHLEIFTSRGETLVFEPLPEDADVSPRTTTWVLATFVEGEVQTPVLAGTEITLEFEGDVLRERGTVSGSAGCNTYEATYSFINDFTFEPPTVTEMACATPAGIMEQEQRYLSVLKDVTTYRIEDSRLQLETGDGRALVFVVRA